MESLLPIAVRSAHYSTESPLGHSMNRDGFLCFCPQAEDKSPLLLEGRVVDYLEEFTQLHAGWDMSRPRSASEMERLTRSGGATHGNGQDRFRGIGKGLL